MASARRTTRHALLITALGATGLVGCGQPAIVRIETGDQAVACAEEALGGRDTLAAVSAITVTMNSTPVRAPAEGRRAVELPTTAEVTVAWPDRFRYVSRAVRPDGGILHSIRGIAGDETFVASVDGGVPRRLEIDAGTVAGARHQMAQWAFMLLLRDTSIVPLELSLAGGSETQGAGPTIVARGTDDIEFRLELDAATCLPVAMSWHRAPNFGDSMSGRVPVAGRFIEKRVLLDYQEFEGVRLPTRMRGATDDVVRSEWAVTAVDINPPLPADFVPGAGTEPAGHIFGQ